MRRERPSVLVIGFGNPGRVDDGLGPALAAAVAEMRLDGVTVDCDYQLVVEAAAELAGHDVVIFADADVSCEPPFTFTRLEPAADVSFTTHSISPASLLALARDYFDASTRGYMLAIRGYEFNEFGERLSDGARANLEAAVRFLETILHARCFDEATRSNAFLGARLPSLQMRESPLPPGEGSGEGAPVRHGCECSLTPGPSPRGRGEQTLDERARKQPIAT
jgi:hydrogenase maturation protease